LVIRIWYMPASRKWSTFVGREIAITWKGTKLTKVD
jgi:hypothetical protein